MKRGGYLKRRKGVRRVSERRLELLGQRIEMLAGFGENENGCHAAELVPSVACAGPLDPHEPLTRGRGGSITDRANVIWVCRKHHGWLHRNPDEAHRLGLLVHSWEKPA